MANVVGVDKALDTLKNYDKTVKKCVSTAQKKTARDLTALIKGAVPKTFKRLVKSKTKNNSKTDYIAVGLLWKKDKQLDWFKAYWSNYGTLGNRDPQHHFDRPRKNRTRNWKGGIRAKRFWPVAGLEDKAFNTFSQELERAYNEIQL